MISVFVRASMMTSPRFDMIFLMIGTASLALAYDSLRVKVIGSCSSSCASRRDFRAAASCASFCVLAMRTTLFSNTLSRPLFLRMMSSAWSSGTFSRTMVSEPATAGSSTML